MTFGKAACGGWGLTFSSRAWTEGGRGRGAPCMRLAMPHLGAQVGPGHSGGVGYMRMPSCSQRVAARGGWHCGLSALPSCRGMPQRLRHSAANARTPWRCKAAVGVGACELSDPPRGGSLLATGTYLGRRQRRRPLEAPHLLRLAVKGRHPSDGGRPRQQSCRLIADPYEITCTALGSTAPGPNAQGPRAQAGEAEPPRLPCAPSAWGCQQ
jgi:hypothetical protein